MYRTAARFEGLEARQHFSFGDVDTAFGTNGRVDTTNSTLQTSAYDVAPLTDGRLAVLDVDGVKLFTAAGTRVNAFGTSGKIATDSTHTNDLIAVGSGKFLLTETYSVQGTLTFKATRYNADGTVDTAYGTNGVLSKSFAAQTAGSATAVTAADGSLYLAYTPALDGSDSPFDNFSTAVYKFTAAGQTATSWGSNGGVQFGYKTPGGGFYQRAYAQIVVTTDGSLLLAGTNTRYSVGSDPNSTSLIQSAMPYGKVTLVATRLTAAGALDTGFGDGGTVSTTIQPSLTSGYRLAALGDNTGLLAFNFSNDPHLQTLFLPRQANATFVPRSGGEVQFTRLRQLVTLADGRVVAVGNRGFHTFVVPITVSGGATTFGPTIAAAASGTIGGTESVVAASGNSLLVAGDAYTDANGNGTVDSGELASRYTLLKLSAGTAGETRPDFIAGGNQNDAVVAADGTLSIAYYDAATKNLKYRQRDTSGRWGATETIDAAANTGLYLSLDISPTGTIGVAYFDGNGGDLKYAERQSNGEWVSTNVDVKNSTGLYPSLNYSYDGRPYISYFAGTAGDLRLASRSAGGTWAIETIDSVGNTGRHSVLRIDPARGTFAVAYEADGGVVKLAERSKKKWALTTVGSTAGGVDAIDFGFDYYGPDATATEPATAPVAAVVSYYDASPADLVLARRRSGDTTFGRTTVASRGATGLFSQLDILPLGNTTTAKRAFYWDRKTDSVLSGYDTLATGLKKYTVAPRNDAAVYATGGGRFLNFAQQGTLHTALAGGLTTIAYYDTASRGLVVRDV